MTGGRSVLEDASQETCGSQGCLWGWDGEVWRKENLGLLREAEP